jgi:hypothetical protein
MIKSLKIDEVAGEKLIICHKEKKLGVGSKGIRKFD